MSQSTEFQYLPQTELFSNFGKKERDQNRRIEISAEKNSLWTCAEA